MSRTSYHHGDLRNAMIEAALRLVEREGLHKFSMREAAREAGVAPSAPYRHFDDKTALMTAVAEAALAELIARSEDAIARAPASPLEQFRAAGIAYVRFAYERPAHFRVLHDPECARRDASELLSAYFERADALVRATVDGAGRDGELSERLPQELVQLTASTLMYGLARQIVDGQLDPDLTAEQVEDLAMQLTYAVAVGIARV
jgi:AcrR family transcriptional regulator